MYICISLLKSAIHGLQKSKDIFSILVHLVKPVKILVLLIIYFILLKAALN